MVEVQRVISSRFGQGSLRPSERGKGQLPKACVCEDVWLGLTNNICPTVVFAECYRDLKCVNDWYAFFGLHGRFRLYPPENAFHLVLFLAHKCFCDI